jgi:hypothetical protein
MRSLHSTCDDAGKILSRDPPLHLQTSSHHTSGERSTAGQVLDIPTRKPCGRRKEKWFFFFSGLLHHSN